jgi:hypothetical protein
MCNADRSALDLSTSTLLVSPTAPCSPAATPSSKAFYRVPASQTPRPLRSNLHSASRTPAVPSSRFPPLEDFVRRPRRARNRSQRPASEILHIKGRRASWPPWRNLLRLRARRGVARPVDGDTFQTSGRLQGVRGRRCSTSRFACAGNAAKLRTQIAWRRRAHLSVSEMIRIAIAC